MTKLAIALAMLLLIPVVAVDADEAPIAGTVKAVDPAAQTLTLTVTAKGKTREVVVYMRPGAKVVKFARATAPGTSGFVEQEVSLGDVKPGWVVSATTKHDGGKEVADVVKVVMEK